MKEKHSTNVKTRRTEKEDTTTTRNSTRLATNCGFQIMSANRWRMELPSAGRRIAIGANRAL